MELELRRQAQQKAEREKPNTTGIPTQMKLNFEARSGLSFDDVRVHYNSDKPAQIGALAYTEGTQVHIGPGQERHLRHELGHVVQQKQGRVRPNSQINGQPVNSSAQLEQEADAWGKSVVSVFDASQPAAQRKAMPAAQGRVIQRLGERDAVNETFPFRRGNRRGSIVGTNFDSACKLSALLEWLSSTFWEDFRRAYPSGPVELYYLMRAEAVKMARVANCDDYATVTFAHIAQNTRGQWVYRCHMEPTSHFHHAFTITSPNELQTGYLPKGTNIECICVVDGWSNYQISTLEQFCKKKNPYAEQLAPTENIYIDHKLEAGSRILNPDEKAFATSRAQNFLAQYRAPMLSEEGKRSWLESGSVFDFPRPEPRVLNDIRPNAVKILDMKDYEQTALLREVTENDCVQLLDRFDEDRRDDILAALSKERRMAYLKFLWNKGKTKQMKHIMNNVRHFEWVEEFINSLPSWRLGLTKTKALNMLDDTMKIYLTRGPEYLV